MKINNGLVIPGALALAIFTGAVTLGMQIKTVEEHGERIEKLEQTPLKVWAIDKRTSVMQEKIEALTREQRDFRQTMVKALDRILRKLDR